MPLCFEKHARSVTVNFILFFLSSVFVNFEVMMQNCSTNKIIKKKSLQKTAGAASAERRGLGSLKVSRLFRRLAKPSSASGQNVL